MDSLYFIIHELQKGTESYQGEKNYFLTPYFKAHCEKWDKLKLIL